MWPIDGQLTILNAEQKPIWYANFSNDYISLEFESYGHGNGPDIEAFEKIPSSEFAKILEHFAFDPEYPMRWLFEDLSNAGRGQDLKDFIRERVDIKTEFVWFSFPDD